MCSITCCVRKSVHRKGIETETVEGGWGLVGGYKGSEAMGEAERGGTERGRRGGKGREGMGKGERGGGKQERGINGGGGVQRQSRGGREGEGGYKSREGRHNGT